MSNFFKRTKRAWEELEYDQAHQRQLRRNPLTEQECRFPQPEPLFPRHILEPLYEQWKRYHDNGSNNAEQFFIFLLKQAKPEPLTQTTPSGSTTVQNTEETK